MAKKPMSENSRKVLEYLKNAGVGVKFTYKQVATDLGFDKVGAVVGSITSFAKKEKVDKFEESVTDSEGKTKVVKFFALNDAGAAWDPDAETDED